LGFSRPYDAFPFFASQVVESIIDDVRRRHSLDNGKPIIVATYPKCGTTWMQQILLTLLAGGDGRKVRDPMKVLRRPLVTSSPHDKS
jgi:hypothetical protein